MVQLCCNKKEHYNCFVLLLEHFICKQLFAFVLFLKLKGRKISNTKQKPKRKNRHQQFRKRRIFIRNRNYKQPKSYKENCKKLNPNYVLDFVMKAKNAIKISAHGLF